ncbi:MAG: hypothetical protein ACQR33_01985 [Candidatus Saccharibacteria bacterium]
MERVLEDVAEQSPCAAVRLANHVDNQINGGALREFADATSALQESGADLGEGSAYLHDGSVSFTEQSVACGLCKGIATLSTEGSIDAKRCPVSGSCEVEWVERYPDNYRDEDGALTAKRLVCGAEIGCDALINLVDTEGALGFSVHGTCELAWRGDRWQATRDMELRNTVCSDPDRGIEKFDGETLGDDTFLDGGTLYGESCG